MGKWVLTIIWKDGTRDYRKFNERINAEQAEQGYRLTHGHKISSTSIKWRWNN